MRSFSSVSYTHLDVYKRQVLQNLLDNAERYAMPGTRLYVTVETGDQVTRLTMTNTAAYEMTFTAEEVLQRFVRGDKSRTGDGSGLGPVSYTHLDVHKRQVHIVFAQVQAEQDDFHFFLLRHKTPFLL